MRLTTNCPKGSASTKNLVHLEGTLSSEFFSSTKGVGVLFFLNAWPLFFNFLFFGCEPYKGYCLQKKFKNLPMLYVMGPLTPRVLPYSSCPQNFPGEHVVQPILGRTKHQAKQMVGKKINQDITFLYTDNKVKDMMDHGMDWKIWTYWMVK